MIFKDDLLKLKLLHDNFCILPVDVHRNMSGPVDKINGINHLAKTRKFFVNDFTYEALLNTIPAGSIVSIYRVLKHISDPYWLVSYSIVKEENVNK